MRVVVIGGSAAGLKAACRLARLKPEAKISVLVETAHFACSNCGLPYFLSGDVDDVSMLMRTSDGSLKDVAYFRDVKGIEILPQHRALRIDVASKSVEYVNLGNGCEGAISYDRLILATGSSPSPLGIPGGDLPDVVSIVDPAIVSRLRSRFETGQINRVAVIGAGFIGLEICEALRSLWGAEVDLFEIAAQPLPGLLDPEMGKLAAEELRTKGVRIHLSCRIVGISRNSNGLTLNDNLNRSFEVDCVVNASGFHPNVELARCSGLTISEAGGIKANEFLQTSHPDIYAAGDCVEITSALNGRSRPSFSGSVASKMGRIVANNIAGQPEEFLPLVGVEILKVFDLSIGMVGLTESECRREDVGTRCSWGTFYDRLHYYPDAGHICCKLICDQQNDRIIGFQAVGKGQILHVLDKAVQLIRNNAKISNINSIEHAYAPPYSQTFDPLVYLGCIIENCRNNGIEIVAPADLNNGGNASILLDVRSNTERSNSPITSTMRTLHIPVNQLRARITGIPPGNRVVTLCQMGSRAYEAALILKRSGIDRVGFLAGGALFQPRSDG